MGDVQRIERYCPGKHRVTQVGEMDRRLSTSLQTRDIPSYMRIEVANVKGGA